MGMVGTASAGKLYIKITNPGWWGNDNAITAISFDEGSFTDMSTIYMYGHKWAVADLPTSYSSVKIKRHVSSNYYDETTVTISGTDDNYQEMSNGTLTSIDVPSWTYLVFRQNIINWEGNNGTTWNDNDMHNTSHPDRDTFIFELTKNQIENSSNKGEGIRFRLRNSEYVYYNDAGESIDGYPQIYPTASDAQIAIGNSTATYYHNTNTTTWSWLVEIPSYDYTKIVLTAKYVNESGYKWKISADAYLPAISTNASGYSTYTVGVPVKIPVGVTAYYATDDGDGSATAHAITDPAANTPMLIKGAASTSYSFAVAASGTDYSGTNAFKAGTSTTAADGLATGEGPYNYILNGNAFYAANGKKVAEGKAYLQLSQPATTRALVFPGEKEAGISVITNTAENVNAIYNLSGQRVANPSKGLYIVNGHKVIMK